MQVDAFLKKHEIFDYSAADFEQDRETLRELRMKEARS
jgi:PHD/YefM family antitoxin component YafN of YafNO toxin-antitoxin module